MQLEKNYISGTEQLVTESKRIIIQEKKIDMPSEKEQEKEKSHPIMIVGSNNVVGKNVFLFNTGSEQDVQDFLQHLPPEVWDAMVVQMTNITNTNNNSNLTN